MSNDNIEPISAKLRRWADESYESGMYPTERSEIELRVDGVGQTKAECELFRHIADEIDREKREITERYTRQSWMNPADAIAKLATGEIEWAELRQAIDRYYLPRPLFEDGEPVQDSDLEEIRGFATCCVYTDGSWKFDPDKFENEGNPKPWDKQQGRQGDRIKRPEQPVLDAEGVPIEVGETLYRAKHAYHPGKEVHVYGIACEETPYGYGRVFTTPERTVRSGWEVPENLTHREPDTQERIDMDAQESSHDYWKCYGYACSKCPAMFDGKIPSEHYGVSSCLEAQKLDLLRRQRELDGSDA